MTKVECRMKAEARNQAGRAIRHSPFVIRRSPGFTLMEVLLAVLIFAIVLGAINSVFFAAIKLRNATTQSLEKSQPIEQALAIIKRDLANIVMPDRGIFSGTLVTSGAGGAGAAGGFGTLGGQSAQFGSASGNTAATLTGNPEFYTATGSINEFTPWADIERVSYYLAAPTNNTPGKDLMRVLYRNFLPVAEEEYTEQFLMSGVDEITFQFYDGTQWIEYWDSTAEPTNALPRAIKISIALTEEGTSRSSLAPIELVVPLSLQLATNETAQASTGGGG